jgi:hypothetical protein
VCRVLVGKPEGKRPLGRTKLRWEDDIKSDLQEVGCGLGWLKIETGGLAFVNSVKNLLVP